MTTLDLSGIWSLTDAEGNYQCDLPLPGDGISALHDAGLIPDPYWGRNEYDLRWICDTEWEASRRFTLTDTDVDLVLSGLDTVVTVRVNDAVVLKARNAFRTFRVPLSGIAVAGENIVAIAFHSVVQSGKKAHNAHPFPLPNSKNCPIPYGNMLRKPACDFGWDWNIALAPFGVLGDMRIDPAGKTRIDRLAIQQNHSDNKISLTVTAHLAEAQSADYAFSFAGQTIEGVANGETVCVIFDIENPELWWPAGQGAQTLHDLVVRVDDAVETRRIGLRRMQLITTPDATGMGFKFAVNGRDVFCKGANWVPADALAGRITPEKTRDLLQSAVDANMNMIRVWGGGRYEDTWFYDLCDELGLMVWQDFMFACNLYPSDAAFVEEVRAEVHDNVARMHHHACLAVWCGDNELIGALDWYDCSRKDRDRYLVNYDRLNRAIEEALLETDPDAVWWPSSPSPGPLNFGDAWHDDGSGDMHFWSVWHEGRDFDHYRDVAPRFCSEFGFQSYPSLKTIRKFADPADFNIAAPVLESHQKNTGGNARIAETMFRYFRWPAKFEDFVYLSQVQQGLAIKTAVTHWRGLQPHCMGTLIWQLNDTWPVCSWASLDHGGDWKILHHMARNFFAPVTVVVVPEGDALKLRAVNDTGVPLTVTVESFAATMDGTTRPLGKAFKTCSVPATDILTVGLHDLGENEVLAIVWSGSDGSKGGDIFAPLPWKTYALENPELAISVTKTSGGYAIQLEATKAVAFYVAVEADVAGRFSDAGFALFPGHPTTITFTPSNPNTEPNFTLRNLHSATTA